MMDLKKMQLAVSSTCKEQDCYVKYCREIDLDPEWINCTFRNKSSNKTYKLIGLNKKGRMFSVVIEQDKIKYNYSIKQFMDNSELVEE